VHLHIDRLRLVTTLAALIATLSVYAAPAQMPATDAAQTPGPSEIVSALERVKNDPNLAPDQTIKVLRWRDATEERPTGRPTWLRWISGLFRWFEQLTRVLVWVAAVVMVAVLGVYIARNVRKYSVTHDVKTFVAPSHVRDLDIRPESLPDDIGIAARLLWDRGEHRASLALLYRGMLTRLAHVYSIPIRHSSTEGDCLALAASGLTRQRLEYVSRVVLVWQRFVYGRRDTHAATVYELCDEFARSLDYAAPLDAIRSGKAG